MLLRQVGFYFRLEGRADPQAASREALPNLASPPLSQPHVWVCWTALSSAFLATTVCLCPLLLTPGELGKVLDGASNRYPH